VARMGRGEVFTGFRFGDLTGRDHWEDLGSRWEGNVKMDHREIGIDGANWIQVAHDRVWWWAFVNTVMNLRVP
jgi:hypothetical protein